MQEPSKAVLARLELVGDVEVLEDAQDHVPDRTGRLRRILERDMPALTVRATR